MSRRILMLVLMVGGGLLAAAQPAGAQVTQPGATAQGGGGVCGSRGNAAALEVIGLTTDQRLICFIDQQPDQPRAIGPVGGLQGGERLVGIDFRPANGMLYGVGNAGGIYIINPLNGQARRQSTLRTEQGQAVALRGTSFGVDFNPVPDRLRIISDQGQSLRVNVDNGATLSDAALNPAPGTGLNAVAYTNNDTDPSTGTVLYDLDTTSNQLMIQAPPNAGTLNPVGNLRVDAEGEASFDIFSLTQQGTTVAVVGLASLRVGGRARFVEVDLTTGRIGALGTFQDRDQVIGIAIPLVQSAPMAAQAPAAAPTQAPAAPPRAAPAPTPAAPPRAPAAPAPAPAQPPFPF